MVIYLFIYLILLEMSTSETKRLFKLFGEATRDIHWPISISEIFQHPVVLTSKYGFWLLGFIVDIWVRLIWTHCYCFCMRPYQVFKICPDQILKCVLAKFKFWGQASISLFLRVTSCTKCEAFIA